MDRIIHKMAELGLVLPPAPKPVAAYVPAVRTGNLIFVSGQVPFRDGELIATGHIPSEISLKQAQEAARQCVLNGLAVIAGELSGNLELIKRIVRLGVFISCDPGFIDQPRVANGASELLVEIFGEAGKHARAAVGSVSLPLGSSVEVEMIVEIADSLI